MRAQAYSGSEERGAQACTAWAPSGAGRFSPLRRPPRAPTIKAQPRPTGGAAARPDHHPDAPQTEQARCHPNRALPGSAARHGRFTWAPRGLRAALGDAQAGPVRGDRKSGGGVAGMGCWTGGHASGVAGTGTVAGSLPPAPGREDPAFSTECAEVRTSFAVRQWILTEPRRNAGEQSRKRGVVESTNSLATQTARYNGSSACPSQGKKAHANRLELRWITTLRDVNFHGLYPAP